MKTNHFILRPPPTMITNAVLRSSALLLLVFGLLITTTTQSIAVADESVLKLYIPEAGVSANHNNRDARKARDPYMGSRWTTRQRQQPGQFFSVDLGSSQAFNQIVLDAHSSDRDYPRSFSVYVSNDGANWGEPVATGDGESSLTTINFPTKIAQFLKIEQTGSDGFFWWSIHNIEVNQRVIEESPIDPNDPAIFTLDRSVWKLSSSNKESWLELLRDTDLTSRWATQTNQESGQYVQIELEEVTSLSHLVMQTETPGQGASDYPRRLDVLVSEDGLTWALISSEAGSAIGETTVNFNRVKAKFIKLVQTGNDDFYWWSIYDLHVYGIEETSGDNQPPTAEFVAPDSSSDYVEGDNLFVEVQAQDSDGEIAWVDLYIDDELTRRDSLPPYEWGWSGSLADQSLKGLPAGVHTLRAVVADTEGAESTIVTTVEFSEDETVPNDPMIKEHSYTKNDGPDKNPLKGWNSGWWDDRQEASVGFQYIKWKDFEPRNGEFDYGAIEDIIDRPGSENRHVALRLYCDWHGDQQTSRGCPDWIYSQVGVKRIRGDNGRYITDYNDPRYIDQAIQAIQALAQRYDNDPRMHSFQLGILGYWGEWHTYGSDYEISEQAQMQILNAYQNAFSKAKLVGRYPWRPILSDANGIGFHNDYFRPNNGHSKEFDESVDAGQKWLNGPIGGEIPPGLSGNDFDALYLTSQGTEMIEQGRYSTMKPTSVSGAHLSSHMRLHRLMGYNYQIQRALFAESIFRSDPLSVNLQVENIGVAPLYYDWQVQFALLNGQNEPVVVSNADSVDLTSKMPDEVFDLSATIAPQSVGGGSYKLAVRIIQPGADLQKSDAWKLDARNTYILFSNNLPVVNGNWGSGNKLTGGWSVLGNVQVN